MKIHRVPMLALALLAAGAAWSAEPAAAPDKTNEPWISPEARTLIDKVTAAFAGLESWTATIVSTHRIVSGKGPVKGTGLTTERYLRLAGTAGLYAAARSFPAEPAVGLLSCQNQDAKYLLARTKVGNSGHVFPPDDWDSQPEMWTRFDASIRDTDCVRHIGQETVAGEYCDVLETLKFTPASTESGDKPGAPMIRSTRFAITPAGWIIRTTDSTGRADANLPWVTSQAVAYDAKAKLTVADFSREAFEREAAVALRGEPMPEMEVKLFAPGGSLPAMSFIGWEDKRPFRISDLQGKVVVVETWTSWCHFCKLAFPTYEKARQAVAGQDVVFVAVSFDEKPANYEKWMNQNAANYGFKFGLVQTDDAKKALKEFRGSLPGFYVLGRDGKIVRSYLGFGYKDGDEDPRLIEALRSAGIKI